MIPESIQLRLLQAVSSVGADLTDECQEFLSAELAAFSGSHDDFIAHVQEYVRVWFRSSSSLPEWIQNAEWQFDEGKPMQFIGQVAIPTSSGLFHDEAVVFVFANEKGMVKTVLQVS